MALLKGFPPSNTISPGRIGPPITTTSTSTKSVDELIDGFFNNTLSDDDYKDLYDVLRDKKQPAPPKEPEVEEKKKAPTVEADTIYGVGEVGFVLSNGIQIMLNKKGGFRATYGGKDVEIEEDAMLNIPLSTLTELWAAGTVMHETDKKQLIGQVDGLEQKTRFVNKTNKKMFVTGIALGRQGH